MSYSKVSQKVQSKVPPPGDPGLVVIAGGGGGGGVENIMDGGDVAADWQALGGTTIEDVDGAVVITYVDTATAARLDLSVADGTLTEDRIQGNSYDFTFTGKANQGTVKVDIVFTDMVSVSLNTGDWQTITTRILVNSPSVPYMSILLMDPGEVCSMKDMILTPVSSL